MWFFFEFSNDKLSGILLLFVRRSRFFILKIFLLHSFFIRFLYLIFLLDFEVIKEKGGGSY